MKAISRFFKCNVACTLLLFLLGVTSTALGQFLPDPGKWYRIVFLHSGHCMRPAGGVTGNSIQIEQSAINVNDLSQLWRFEVSNAPGGYYFPINQNGKAFDIYGTSRGSYIGTWDMHNGDNQQFRFDASPTPGYFFMVDLRSAKNNTNYTLDVEGGSTSAGAKVLTWDKKPGGYQNQVVRFEEYEPTDRFIPNPVYWYRIVFLHSGKCMRPAGGATANNIQIEQSDVDNTDQTQLWCFQPGVANGYYYPVNQNGKSFDIYGTSRGSYIGTWDMHNGDNQQFRFDASPTPGYFFMVDLRSAKNNTNYTLDVEGASTNAGAKVLTWDKKASGYQNQVVRFERVTIGRNYYLDTRKTINGDGTRANPWNNVESVNTRTFNPGDKILLAQGTTIRAAGSILTNRFTNNNTDEILGVLTPRGSGNINARITIDSYNAGYGNAKPLIDAEGVRNSAAVLLYNQDFWTVRNVSVTNDVPVRNWNSQSYRFGIFAYWDDGADPATNKKTGLTDAPHGAVTIEQCDVNHVYGAYVNNTVTSFPSHSGIAGFSNVSAFQPAVGGIQIQAQRPTRVDQILIQGNTVTDIVAAGIRCNGDLRQLDGIANWSNSSTNVVIRSNRITTTCDGIVVGGLKDVLIEYNVVDNAGANNVVVRQPNGDPNTEQGSLATGGIWTACCDGGTIQYNEVKNSRMLPGDGQALNSDISLKGTITFQYNYTYGNEGGFFQSCSPTGTSRAAPDEPGSKTVVRYNISQNDGSLGEWYIVLYKGNGELYNNTFYVTNRAINIGNPNNNLNNNTFTNNIFYTNSNALAWGPTGFIYNSNCFFGLSNPPPSTVSYDDDPQFVSPGTAGVGLNSAAQCYKFNPTSLYLSTYLGQQVPGAPTRDFEGNPIAAGRPQIGALTSTAKFPDPTKWYRIISAASDEYSNPDNYNYGLNLDNLSTIQNGSNIQVWTYGGSITNELWRFIPNSDGSYKMTTQVAPNLFLNVDYTGGVHDGSNVQVWSQSNQPEEDWFLTLAANGTYMLNPKINTAMCLNVNNEPYVNGAPSMANGRNVQVWSFGGGQPNERWKIIPVP